MAGAGGEAAPVVVVGAGPTGLVAASLLAGYGVPTVVLERHPEPYALPRAVHLDDEVARILQRVGVAEAFAACSRPAPGMRLLDARHRVLAEFGRAPAGRHGYPEANLFDQPDLEQVLRAGLAAHPSVELRTGTEVTGLAPAGRDRVRVAVRDAAGTPGEVLAAAVLGCDGAHSVTRAAIGARLRDLRFTERWLVLDVRCGPDLGAWDGIWQVCDPRRAATFLRVGPGRYRWEFRLHAGEAAADLLAPDRLGPLLAPWLGPVPVGSVEVLRSAEYTFRARLADRWSAGRVFLLGDAAHLTPPFIGQGLGSGLRDAANLTWKLARVLDGRAGERLLDTYERERKPHARQLIRVAVAAGWALTGGQDGAAAVRRAVLAGLCRVPWTRDRLSAATVPRLPAGPLVRRPRVPARRRDRLVGDSCPQPWVGDRRLDDLLGPGFALLADGPVDPALRALAARTAARRLDLADLPGGAPALRDWLRSAGAGAALVRPDRIVMATGPRMRAPAERSRRWIQCQERTEDAGAGGSGRPGPARPRPVRRRTPDGHPAVAPGEEAHADARSRSAADRIRDQGAAP